MVTTRITDKVFFGGGGMEAFESAGKSCAYLIPDSM